jgi:hypothetical protein
VVETYDTSVLRSRDRSYIETIHPAVVVGQDSASAEASDVCVAQAAT